MAPAIRAIMGGVLAVLALASSTVQAQDQKRIELAIQAGVSALKQQQLVDGSWPYGQVNVQPNNHWTGPTALAAVTLLECDISPDDPIIQRAAAVIRNRAAREGSTYDIALALMFLDRLGKAEDESLIQTLTSRLLKGQNAAGGWSYYCPVEGPAGPLPGRGIPAAAAAPLPAAAASPPGGPPVGGGEAVAPNAQQGFVPGPGLPGAPNVIRNGMVFGDNSNTQFATLALWVSRRHKLAADQALEAVGQRFRTTQHLDGGWSYNPAANQLNSTPTMTCAGLLGMAVSYGVAREATLRTQAEKPQEGGDNPKRAPREANKDPAIRLGLLALGQLLNGPYAFAQRGPGVIPAFVQGPVVGAQRTNLFAGTDYYLLWSVDRVAMAFGLRTIGRLDWYAWGSKIAVATQNPDGTWQGSYGSVVDTSFALLFLRRSNLAKDLSNDLKDLVRDPGEVRLRAGGIGGKGLQGRDTSLEPGAVGKADHKARPSRRNSIPDLRPDTEADTPAANRPSADAKADSPDPEAFRLSAAVVQATGTEQEALIDHLRDARGVINTDALAAAIPQLRGSAKTRARDALAERLTRMTAATLRDKLKDEDLEIRRAAALASAMKSEQSFVPDLIALLSDPEPPVARAAHAALKALAREDFGPEADATRAERTAAISKWKAWWASQKK
jgi:hypothetical protein